MQIILHKPALFFLPVEQTLQSQGVSSPTCEKYSLSCLQTSINSDCCQQKTHPSDLRLCTSHHLLLLWPLNPPSPEHSWRPGLIHPFQKELLVCSNWFHISLLFALKEQRQGHGHHHESVRSPSASWQNDCEHEPG